MNLCSYIFKRKENRYFLRFYTIILSIYIPYYLRRFSPAMNVDVDQLVEKSKDFEQLTLTFDVTYDDQVAAVEIVRQFIIDNNLIVYGGTAIDFALRLKGDNIYPDSSLTIPDLDFYSPRSVEHAYELADILYKHGFKKTRAICALHMETMHVDLENNHFIADISYRPQKVFDTLPYIIYNGMRSIMPDFQRIDIHSSLSFPFDNPPREVIFARWSKDIKRFNKMVAKYPIKAPKNAVDLTQAKTSTKFIFTGFAAYSIIYNIFAQEAESAGVKHPNVVSAPLTVAGETISFDTVDTIDIVDQDVEKLLKKIGAEDIKYFRPYVNLVPARAQCRLHGSALNILSVKNRLISVNSVSIGNTKLRITNIQYVLKYFLSMSFMRKGSPRVAAAYLKYYLSLISMIEFAHLLPKCELLFPTVNTYGSANVNLAQEVSLARLNSELYGAEQIKTPMNYYPARLKPHPSFDALSIPFFNESGEECDGI